MAAAGRRGPIRGQAGLSIIELMVAMGVLAVVLAIAVNQWHDYSEWQRLRYGTVQVATDLREAQERARAERRQYTVTFTSGSAAYAIAGPGYSENAEMPAGVTATATQTIYFSAFGKPVTVGGAPTAYSVTVQNPKGSGTISITQAGGITYSEP
ncbi:MAG: prepilin-type N-terminal cleavage/methylation domain-containing protein [Armatimonadota bacterium]|nr:prepilin-type N-terminal cleavage/methylation domain-containing protein [Armatimonadota bacterium]MDR7450428.1 prepilin-type N-terminal cleavage/methylation domain-containing protein [Armatimonadota bacterium]MDR7466989.1 prepilin-type N-terminal cleavage/methylation domain-containing protein [Armatimonadota bacterium]MDR7493469.1 prepilin-type N-terminal cleavage/methylation domain-containing protein [Armatimonadota bacterium]MDR7498734.1 prepilin-type N-terminal cleavage/methylation domain